MTKQSTDPQQRPGNDGSWYLQLLGFDGEADTASSAAGHLQALLRQEDPPDLLEDWSPEALSRKAASRRTFRWSVITFVVLVGVLTAFTIWWVPRVAEQRVEDRITRVRVSLVEVRNSLPSLQQALAIATEPATSVDDLAATAPPLAAALASAERLTSEGVDPLPDVPPIIGSQDLEILSAEQSRFSFMGAEASAVTQRISTVIAYRTGVDQLFAVPPLPTSASGEELSAVSVALANTLADSVAASAGLPADAALAGHAESVTAAIARFGDWQVEYIDRLRRTLSDDAATLISEWEAIIADLDVQLIAALGAIRSDLDTSILELASQLDRTLLRLPA